MLREANRGALRLCETGRDAARAAELCRGQPNEEAIRAAAPESDAMAEGDALRAPTLGAATRRAEARVVRYVRFILGV